jgi:type I restriction enzyme R subunit
MTPEQQSRQRIDAALAASGWAVQNRDDLNLASSQGVAVREFKLTQGHGYADYLLFVDGKAVGVLEAKPEGFTLSGVEPQARKYAEGLPSNLHSPIAPLPFLYLSNGSVTTFTNLLDGKPRSREVFAVHRPETLAGWLEAPTLDAWVKGRVADGGLYTAADDTRPSTLRTRLSTLPPLDVNLVAQKVLFPNQHEAVTRLERSLREDRPRSLIQMATGSGKTFMAVTSIYRLIKLAGARRVLFLVDRANLGEQAEKEFQGFRTPDDRRKLTELYNLQRLTSNQLGASTKVAITTIQRLYSMLKGEPDLDPGLEEVTAFDAAAPREPLPVVYNPGLPPETFDIIFVDECHRSIYSLWRQVLEYFDAHLVGLTATPAAHTYGFFHGNLVMEYGHEKAVADGVNVQFLIYKIRTRITVEGSTIEAGPDTTVRLRTRSGQRWLKLDEDLRYAGSDLDRSVVTPDQMRTVVRAFRDRVLTEIFPGRKHVPKTLVFAKDDQHAEDLVALFREEFGEGNDFCQKITYKTTGQKPADLIQAFRTSFYPRVAVTVDMIATGTDIRPVEIVMFMRSVQSRVLFEQMKGRGVRVITPTDLGQVSPDAGAKTHFVIVDCVGVTESELMDTQPLERKRATSLRALLDHVAAGGVDPDVLSSLAGRLARLDRECSAEERASIRETAEGLSLGALAGRLVDAVDPDLVVARARTDAALAPGDEPTEAQLDQAAVALAKEAVTPLATRPALRKTLLAVHKAHEQVVDEVSRDELLVDQTGFSQEARDRALAMVASFEQYLAEHRDEHDALRFFYSVPHRQRLRFQDIKSLAEAIRQPPRAWTPEALWRAYELLQRDRVKGASSQRLLTDIVSLVRYALKQDESLRPFPDLVAERFAAWRLQQANQGRVFTAAQVRWLEMMRDHIAASVEIEVEDFDSAPFVQEGGVGRAVEVFGKELGAVLRELNEVLAA